MSNLTSLVHFLDTLLKPAVFRDSALNGLQVESSKQNILKVATAVDAGLSVIEKAIQFGAHLLIVHHGLFWGGSYPITGALAKKIELLLSKGCSLYAAHLPLDAHLEVGNNAELARYMNLDQVTPYFEHDGQPIGVRASATPPRKRDDFIERGKAMLGALSQPLLLPFGKELINTVGIVTGSGSSAISACAEAGIDLLITGEAKQSAYHEAKERKQNVLFLGHYATETFGVRALGTLLKKRFEVEEIFIDEPTGI
jgi:dinuclear metal center YbgI/SA1388 family protein